MNSIIEQVVVPSGTQNSVAGQSNSDTHSQEVQNTFVPSSNGSHDKSVDLHGSAASSCAILGGEIENAACIHPPDNTNLPTASLLKEPLVSERQNPHVPHSLMVTTAVEISKKSATATENENKLTEVNKTYDEVDEKNSKEFQQVVVAADSTSSVKWTGPQSQALNSQNVTEETVSCIDVSKSNGITLSNIKVKDLASCEVNETSNSENHMIQKRSVSNGKECGSTGVSSSDTLAKTCLSSGITSTIKSSKTLQATGVALAPPKVPAKNSSSEQADTSIEQISQQAAQPRLIKPPILKPIKAKIIKQETEITRNQKIHGAKCTRLRTKTQPYQSPIPEVEIIAKISSPSSRIRNNDDKLIVFYKNEFLAIRNCEGGFYVCQAIQNIYRSSHKRLRIRWLSQDKEEKSGEIYTPDFYDQTDFDCILTNINLKRIGRGRYCLPLSERQRAVSILHRSLAAERGEIDSSLLTEEHPDGLDLSLYKGESQLKRPRGVKRKDCSAVKYENEKDNSIKDPKSAKIEHILPTKKQPSSKKDVLFTKQTDPVHVKKLPTSKQLNINKQKNNQNRSTSIDKKKAKALAKVVKNVKAQSYIRSKKKTNNLPKSRKSKPSKVNDTTTKNLRRSK